MVLGTQPQRSGPGRATSSTLTGDPQGGGPHSEENQLRGEILSPLFCGNIQTDQPAENWARGATSQCSGQADEAGVEMVCRGQVEVRLSRKCV